MADEPKLCPLKATVELVPDYQFDNTREEDEKAREKARNETHACDRERCEWWTGDVCAVSLGMNALEDLAITMQAKGTGQ